MKVGFTFPQTELGGDFGAVRSTVLAAEELGFDFLNIYDHVVGAEHARRDPPLNGPYTERDPFHDPFTFLAYAAAITERIELMTGVLILPQRQTVLVAKQAADLALLSQGRFRMGVGVGWNWAEYEALGQSFATRGARIHEQIPLLRRLWSEEVVTHDGRFDHMDRVGLVIRPPQPIEIWSGGHTEAAFRRAARWCDGFIFRGMSAFDPEQWEMLNRHLDANGRSLQGFGTQFEPIDIWLDGVVKIRSVEEIVDIAGQWSERGGTHISLPTAKRGYRHLDEHLAYLADVSHALGRA